ncbi:hypothetical protein HYX17_01095 [Candidatus Woesearchaeota archaeon]|nr:hypothetical protein [Candidatus Woesearchaeota archaeon]
MKNFNIEIKKIEVNKLFLSENKIGYDVYFNFNDEVKKMYIEFPIGDPESIVRMLISEIKRKEKIAAEDENDVLQSIVLMRINNQENVEPRLMDFFTKFQNKVKSFRSKRTADNYIDMYNSIIRERLEL